MEAANLYEQYRHAEGDLATRLQISQDLDVLQTKITATQFKPMQLPRLALVCEHQSDVSSNTEINVEGLLHQIRAGAEVFRHALHIYVYRTDHDALIPLSPQLQESLDRAFDQLPLFPDAIGPAAMQGWALLVLGSELNDVERRHYIRKRLSDLQTLQLSNGMLASQILEGVWRRRDQLRATNVHRTGDTKARWQDVMQASGVQNLLF